MSIIITAKINPDIDGVACILAYAHLLRSQGADVITGIYGVPQEEVNYFITKHHSKVDTTNIDTQISLDTQVVIVDGSSLKGMHPDIKAQQVTEIIDHRIVDYVEGSFPQAKIQIEAVGAAATLIVERYMHTKTSVPADLGLLLFGAIVHNTLWLKSTNTTQRDIVALAHLAPSIPNPRIITQEMFEYAAEAIAKDPASLVKDGKQIMLDGTQVGIYQHIVWDIATTEINELISLAVYANQQATGSAWSCIIVTSISHGKTLLFCPDQTGQSVLSGKLKIRFTENYALLPQLALRKQILEELLKS
jgi:inorganic pyrophosphatase/exopolyphosphatase